MCPILVIIIMASKDTLGSDLGQHEPTRTEKGADGYNGPGVVFIPLAQTSHRYIGVWGRMEGWDFSIREMEIKDSRQGY